MLLGTKALEKNVDGIACGLPAWGQLFLTPFGSLKESLWTHRSLATHSASSQVAPGPEACWPGLDGKAQGPVERSQRALPGSLGACFGQGWEELLPWGFGERL